MLDQFELIPPPNLSKVAVSELASEVEFQLSIPTDDDLSLENVDELLKSVTEAMQDQLDQETKA